MRPSRSGGSVPFSVTTNIQPPSLVVNISGNLEWTFDGPSPFQWRIEQSDFPNPPLPEFLLVDGTLRVYEDPESSKFWQVVGVDSMDTEITEQSNVVST